MAESRVKQALEQLAEYGATDLGDRAGRGELSRAYHRDAQVEQVLRSLADRRSVLLLGPSGVGKTAILHEVVHRLIAAPGSPFRGAGVAQVSTTSIEAGSGNTGAWSQRLKSVVDALIEGHDLFLYVDNIGDLRDAGRYSGMRESFATFLKPYLESRQVVLLGEVTDEEFRHAGLRGGDRGFALADDPSLTGCFTFVTVEEPAPEVVKSILGLVQRELEERHGLEIDPEATARCLELTQRFQRNQSLPGKALRLLRDVAQAAATRGKGAQVSASQVMDGFCRMTGLPDRIFSDAVALPQADLRRFFAERVVGQQAAVDAVVDLVTLVKAELQDPGRPLGVLLFVGPTGTGKTFLAKTLAEYLFGSPDRLVRFDMSEYRNPASLIDLARQLTEKLRRESFAVVLLDEIEKAAPYIFDLFLQAFDDGRLTDPEGTTIDLRNTIIILTSNLGPAAERGPLGFGPGEPRTPAGSQARVQAVEDFFRPEFVNRLDKIVVFRPLERDDVRRIARRELGKALLREGVRRRNILLDFREEVLDVLLGAGFSARYGARPLQRAIKELVLLPLARRIAEQPAAVDQLLELRAVRGQVAISAIPLGGPGEGLPAELVEPDQAEPPAPAASPRELEALEATLAGLGRRLTEQVESDRFRALEARAELLLEEIARPSFWDDRERSQVLLRSSYHLERITDLFRTLRGRLEELTESTVGLRRRRTADGLARLDARVRELERELSLADLELLVSEPDSVAGHGAFVCVSPVVAPGVAQSDAWVAAVAAMYTAWAQRKGYEVEQVSPPDQVETILLIRGPNVAAILRGESGLHKRQSPGPERDQGRRRSLVELARVEVLDLRPAERGAPMFDDDELGLSLLGTPVRSTGDGPARELVELRSADGAGPVRLLATGAAGLARALAVARLELRGGPAEHNQVVRISSALRSHYVRDPRTGERSHRPREVAAGDLDAFLLAYLRAQDPDRQTAPAGR